MQNEFSAETRGPRARGWSRTRPAGLASRAVIAGLAAAAPARRGAACPSRGASQAAGPASAGPASAGPASPASASHGTVVSVRKLPGVGSVLVNGSGMTVYASQEEANGMIECTGSCLGFWIPVKASAAALHNSSGVTGKLGTIHRPDDGMTQLTVNGKPLYTFRLDHAAGQAHGNNFSDNFGGTSFTWHAITASGAEAQPRGSGSSGGNSTPSSGSSGGYSGGY
jgi:predicted lipoprotein with Yx(FWY)xxD motif